MGQAAVMEKWHDMVSCVADHRAAGHSLRFKNHLESGEASIYCLKCKRDLIDGCYHIISVVYEAVLQVPKGQAH